MIIKYTHRDYCDMSRNLQFTVLADVIMTLTTNAAVCHGTFIPHGLSRPPSQWRRRNCSCGMRAVEKAHAISTKTGIILDGDSKSTSCQRISSTPITAERTCVSGRRSSARIVRANRRRLPWVDYLIPCASWQWRECGKVNISRRKLHFIFYLFFKMTHTMENSSANLFSLCIG